MRNRSADEQIMSSSPKEVEANQRSWRVLLIYGLVLAFIGLLGWGLFRANQGQRDQGTAPDFTLDLYEGGTFRLSEQRGKVVMVEFWASWCLPCRQEARTIEALWREYQEKGVVFVGVAYVDTEPEARAYLSLFDITYPNGPDLGTKISQAYRMQGVPEKFFIDKEGQIRAVIIGPVPEDVYRQQINALLNEP
jgi:cytochrome c biogenesis protein CcmG, thiol:disulfide interchange protein DsbE